MTASTSSATPPRRALLPLAVGCGGAIAAGYVAALDPSAGGTYPVCGLRSVTGWRCPGCGLTRAAHHILNGDIRQALGHNALVLPLGGLLIATWVAWLTGSGGHGWVHRAALPAWLALAVVALTFTILRNVPAFDVLRR